ncbi:hypothetical protein JST97_26430 [bacterium]|nr:hypothetical protein [bacterium]
MHRNFTLLSAVILGADFLFCAPAEARGRGGRTGGGLQGRPAQARSGSWGRQGTYTGPRGNTGSWQGTNNTTRGQGTFQNQYQGTRTGPNGQTSDVNRNTTVNQTGTNSWHRDTQQTVTSPNGQQRSWEAQGNGSINKTSNGYEKNYNGTFTNSKGNTTDVNRTTDVTKNADGSVTRDKTSTYTNENTGKTWEVDKSSTTSNDGQGVWTTNRDSSVTGPNGQTMGTGQSTTTGQRGQGTQTTGSWTNQNGQSWQYQGSSTHPQAGETDHTQTVTNPNGQARTTNSTAKWQQVNGQWVRVYDGQTTSTNSTTP